MEPKIGDIWKYVSPLGETHWFVYKITGTEMHIQAIGDGMCVPYNMHLFNECIKDVKSAWKLVSRV